jgi:hypothetical protein
MSASHVLPMQPRRYLGLELAGAKNQKTSLAVLEYYPREQKVFLLDVYDRISAHEGQTGDQALIETLEEATSNEKNRVAKIGVNVPIELPPCITCTRRQCLGSGGCSEPIAKWMRETARKAAESDEHGMNVLEVTPYTQRAFEIWARYRILPELHPDLRFEIDEALGGNRAPLTARMHYLKKHLDGLPIVEVWPKLTISTIAQAFGLPKRLIQNYRKPEEGYPARIELLETIAMKKGVFIYDRDLKKLGQSLTAFDAFICAYTAVLADRDMTARAPKGFPKGASWVAYFPPAGLTPPRRER